MTIPFSKYHGAGNDYLVVTESNLKGPLSSSEIATICHRNYGVGSDGILLISPKTAEGFPVTIYNPDGSEAENSGNGMRIAARYLFDKKEVGNEAFTLLAGKKRPIRAQVPGVGDVVRVEMGKASFNSQDIPVAGVPREVINETITIFGKTLTYSSVSIGNPHCVVLADDGLKELAQTYGPHLEVAERFPKRTNVQFAHVIGRNYIEIEIWERGAGYTLASGSSSCAVAAVCKKLGLVDETVKVSMPGGELTISIDANFLITLVGPVVYIACGEVQTSDDGQKPSDQSLSTETHRPAIL
jgi:diaminopimelate epimerase